MALVAEIESHQTAAARSSGPGDKSLPASPRSVRLGTTDVPPAMTNPGAAPVALWPHGRGRNGHQVGQPRPPQAVARVHAGAALPGSRARRSLHGNEPQPRRQRRQRVRTPPWFRRAADRGPAIGDQTGAVSGPRRSQPRSCSAAINLSGKAQQLALDGFALSPRPLGIASEDVAKTPHPSRQPTEPGGWGAIAGTAPGAGGIAGHGATS